MAASGADRKVVTWRRGWLVALALAALLAMAGPASASHAGGKALPLTGAQLAEIDDLMATPPFDRGEWGMKVVDVESGRTLYGLDRRTPFQAASTTKNFTVAAALDRLGRGHRFRTPVFRSGPVSARGALDGDLVLRASGDLTMGGRLLPDGTVAYTGFDHTDANEVPGPATLTPQNPLAGLNRLARRVQASGIRRVKGDVTIDDRLWRAERVNHEVISPIIVNDNDIDITMTPTTPGEPVASSTRPATDAYSIDVQVRTVEPGGPTDVEVSEVTDGHAVITGTIPAGTKPLVQVLRVPDPAFFARTLFIEALERAGVEVDAPTVAANDAASLPAKARVAALPRIARLISPPLSEFAKLILKVSHNPGANTIPFWIGVAAGDPTLKGGLKRIRRFARRAGVPYGQLALIDGQGSPDNVISPNAQVRLLTYVAEQPYGRAFELALPVKGVDGLPEDPASDPSTGHVFEKNGVNGAEDADGDLEVQAMALAGYVRARGRTLAFDVVVNHVPILGPNGEPTDDPEAIAAAFQNFGTLEAITRLLYESQRRGRGKPDAPGGRR